MTQIECYSKLEDLGYWEFVRNNKADIDTFIQMWIKLFAGVDADIMNLILEHCYSALNEANKKHYEEIKKYFDDKE